MRQLVAGEIDAEPGAVARVRTDVGTRLRREAATSAVASDVVLAISELLDNAVRHGGGSRVGFAVYVVGRRVCVDVSQHAVSRNGRGPDLPPVDQWRMPPPDSVSGRGLAIVAALADEVDVVREQDRTVVVARFGVDAATATDC